MKPGKKASMKATVAEGTPVPKDDEDEDKVAAQAKVKDAAAQDESSR